MNFDSYVRIEVSVSYIMLEQRRPSFAMFSAHAQLLNMSGHSNRYTMSDDLYPLCYYCAMVKSNTYTLTLHVLLSG